MDMRTANVSQGCPENGIICAAAAQIARYYNVPSVANVGCTDSKTYDAQASYEKTGPALMAANAGANMLQGWGMLETNLTCCCAALVVDFEIVGTISRLIQGMNISDETLAVDTVEEIGPGGNFLGIKHTRDFLMKEHFIPQLSDRFKRDTWKKMGGKDVIERAKETAVDILKTHNSEPLEREDRDQIRKIVKEAEKREARKQRLTTR